MDKEPIRKNDWKYTKIDWMAFLKHMAQTDHKEEGVFPNVVLTVSYRPSVASRYWWTLEWTDWNSEKHSVSAQRFDLLVERASELQTDVDFNNELYNYRKRKNNKDYSLNMEGK